MSIDYTDIYDATLADGGATFKDDGQAVHFDPVHRYVVGGVQAYRRTVPLGGFTPEDIRAVVDIVRSFHPSLHTFGTWHDTDTGEVTIEAVELFQHASRALQVARERGEKAIWDAVEGAEIYVHRCAVRIMPGMRCDGARGHDGRHYKTEV